MKRLTLTLIILLPIMAAAQDYDFAKKIGGNTLYFYITSTGGRGGATVEVTFPGSDETEPWRGFRKPVGHVSIPETVTPDRSHGRNADPEDDDTTIYTVTAVRYCAFAGCDRITHLSLPRSIVTVGDSAFGGCKRIEYMAVHCTEPPRLEESSFDKVSLEIPVRIPTGTYQKYSEAIGWRQFSEMTEY